MKKQTFFPKSLSCHALTVAAVLGMSLPAHAQLRTSPSLGSLPLSTANVGGNRVADFIVAVVDNEPITNIEVRTRVLRTEQQMTQQGAAMPGREVLAREVMERLIAERAQIQHAKDTGISIDDVIIDQAVEGLARQNQMNVVDFRKRVEADGTSWATLRRDMRDELILQRVRERDVENRVRVSETEVDDFIRTNADLSNPSQLALNLAQVLIALPDNPTAEQVSAARAKAKGIFDRAKAGEDFGKLALANSQGPERNQGGQMGLREADRYPELFLQATQRLRAGDVAEPIQSGAGFHVIKVLQKRAAAMPDMTVTQTKVRHILLRTSPQLSQDAAARRLTELRQRIIAGQIDFATAARDNGQDATAQQGGDMGWATPGTFVPEFEEAMNQLPEGQVSPPVATRFGVHLLLVDARRDQTLGEREQRELVRNAVRAKKADDNFGNWVQEVRGRAFIDYRDQPQM